MIKRLCVIACVYMTYIVYIIVILFLYLGISVILGRFGGSSLIPISIYGAVSIFFMVLFMLIGYRVHPDIHNYWQRKIGL